MLPSIDTVLYCGRRDQKRGLEQLEVQLYLRHSPCRPVVQGAKLPKSNNIGGLMTLPARIFLLDPPRPRKRKRRKHARSHGKTNSRLLPQWGGLSSGPICSSMSLTLRSRLRSSVCRHGHRTAPGSYSMPHSDLGSDIPCLHHHHHLGCTRHRSSLRWLGFHPQRIVLRLLQPRAPHGTDFSFSSTSSGLDPLR